MKNRFIPLYLATVIATTALGARAEEAEIDVLPEAQVQNGIEFRAGGVGLDEREALRGVVEGYSLWLSFTRRGSNAYASDTGVVIRDAHGHVVLDVLAEGPWLLVKLPAGNYQISAHGDGTEAVTRRITVRAKGLTRHVMHVREAAQG